MSVHQKRRSSAYTAAIQARLDAAFSDIHVNDQNYKTTMDVTSPDHPFLDTHECESSAANGFNQHYGDNNGFTEDWGDNSDEGDKCHHDNNCGGSHDNFSVGKRGYHNCDHEQFNNDDFVRDNYNERNGSDNLGDNDYYEDKDYVDYRENGANDYAGDNCVDNNDEWGDNNEEWGDNGVDEGANEDWGDNDDDNQNGDNYKVENNADNGYHDYNDDDNYDDNHAIDKTEGDNYHNADTVEMDNCDDNEDWDEEEPLVYQQNRGNGTCLRSTSSDLPEYQKRFTMSSGGQNDKSRWSSTETYHTCRSSASDAINNGDMNENDMWDEQSNEDIADTQMYEADAEYEDTNIIEEPVYHRRCSRTFDQSSRKTPSLNDDVFTSPRSYFNNDELLGVSESHVPIHYNREPPLFKSPVKQYFNNDRLWEDARNIDSEGKKLTRKYATNEETSRNSRKFFPGSFIEYHTPTSTERIWQDSKSYVHESTLHMPKNKTVKSVGSPNGRNCEVKPLHHGMLVRQVKQTRSPKHVPSPKKLSHKSRRDSDSDEEMDPFYKALFESPSKAQHSQQSECNPDHCQSPHHKPARQPPNKPPRANAIQSITDSFSAINIHHSASSPSPVRQNPSSYRQSPHKQSPHKQSPHRQSPMAHTRDCVDKPSSRHPLKNPPDTRMSHRDITCGLYKSSSCNSPSPIRKNAAYNSPLKMSHRQLTSPQPRATSPHQQFVSPRNLPTSPRNLPTSPRNQPMAQKQSASPKPRRDNQIANSSHSSLRNNKTASRDSSRERLQRGNTNSTHSLRSDQETSCWDDVDTTPFKYPQCTPPCRPNSAQPRSTSSNKNVRLTDGAIYKTPSPTMNKVRSHVVSSNYSQKDNTPTRMLPSKSNTSNIRSSPKMTQEKVGFIKSHSNDTCNMRASPKMTSEKVASPRMTPEKVRFVKSHSNSGFQQTRFALPDKTPSYPLLHSQAINNDDNISVSGFISPTSAATKDSDDIQVDSSRTFLTSSMLHESLSNTLGADVSAISHRSSDACFTCNSSSRSNSRVRSTTPQNTPVPSIPSHTESTGRFMSAVSHLTPDHVDAELNDSVFSTIPETVSSGSQSNYNTCDLYRSSPFTTTCAQINDSTFSTIDMNNEKPMKARTPLHKSPTKFSPTKKPSSKDVTKANSVSKCPITRQLSAMDVTQSHARSPREFTQTRQLSANHLNEHQKSPTKFHQTKPCMKPLSTNTTGSTLLSINNTSGSTDDITGLRKSPSVTFQKEQTPVLSCTDDSKSPSVSDIKSYFEKKASLFKPPTSPAASISPAGSTKPTLVAKETNINLHDDCGCDSPKVPPFSNKDNSCESETSTPRRYSVDNIGSPVIGPYPIDVDTPNFDSSVSSDSSLRNPDTNQVFDEYGVLLSESVNLRGSDNDIGETKSNQQTITSDADSSKNDPKTDNANDDNKENDEPILANINSKVNCDNVDKNDEYLRYSTPDVTCSDSLPLSILNTTNNAKIERDSIGLGPRNTPTRLSIDSTCSSIYRDPDSGAVLLERHIQPFNDTRLSIDSVTSVTSVDSQATVVYNWKNYSAISTAIGAAASASVIDEPIPADIKRLTNGEIQTELRALGADVGPVTRSSRKLFEMQLQELRLKAKASQKSLPVDDDGKEYSVELIAALSDSDHFSDVIDLEQQMIKLFDDPTKNWRDGHLQASFNYLLLDPRVTQNLPLRAASLGELDCLKIFIAAIFYIGKGSRARPFAHLYDAVNESVAPKRRTCEKIKHILEIWKQDLGVVSLHVFQNVKSVEAFTREACMIEAVGTKELTNVKKGNYYGLPVTWPIKTKRRMGVYLLKKALKIFLAEGERQLFPGGIKTAYDMC